MMIVGISHMDLFAERPTNRRIVSPFFSLIAKIPQLQDLWARYRVWRAVEPSLDARNVLVFERDVAYVQSRS
ncbi:MAG: hypothetical protein IPF95_18425 [Flavobacteriales bacterium]|nr:hypothetical protein [Flavobacteriales bacterium]